jgi:transcriptional regulator with XRE-family HTH domain
MSEKQKDIISKLLRQQGKSKRELAKFLDIHENGINRVLGSSTLGLDKLQQIANFLKLDIKDLFNKIYALSVDDDTENVENKQRIVSDHSLDTTEEIIVLLSEVVQGQKKIAALETQNSDKLSNMMNLIVQTQSLSK